MFNTKSLKEGIRRFTDPDDLPFVKRFFYKAEDAIRFPFNRISYYTRRVYRSIQFACFAWRTYDWDMAYAYDAFGFQLKRLYKAIEKGYSVQEEEDMAAFRELIQIVDRLRAQNYEDKYLEFHDLKWGAIESKTIPEYKENGKVKWYRWESWRFGTKDASEEVKKQEREENRACYENGEKDRLSDIDRLAEILKIHAPKFWD